MQHRPLTAVVAVAFAALTVAAYGSGTGPGTTANSRSAGLRPAQAPAAVNGLGNTYCQSLKGKKGPAFGHCIAAKAHELHQHGKHR
jgi:hypothetical protein